MSSFAKRGGWTAYDVAVLPAAGRLAQGLA